LVSYRNPQTDVVVAIRRVSLPAKVTLDVAGLKLNVNFDGEINLQ